nr:MAG TPA: pentapeptide repeat protein [Caudoviricetes sp.]
MEQKKLDEILEKHRKWLNNEEGSECANLEGADLEGADLEGANLEGANLRDADLRDADLDYSCWPLWCGSLKAHIDDRIGIQLLYHAVSLILYSKYTSKWLKKGVSCVVWICNKFHRVEECSELEEYKEE